MRSLTEVCEAALTKAGVELPEGHVVACRTARSSHPYRWTDGVNEAPGPIITHNRDSCPQAVGDGLCVATSWNAMASGGQSTAGGLLVVGYDPTDVLGGAGSDKLRVRRAVVLLRVWVDQLDLYGANLYGANLSRAYLEGANLRGANLSRADLSRAYLSRAYLEGADLSRAYLEGADLRGANLRRANLRRADLSRADLSRAYLSRAYLGGANLSRAYLEGANLSRANLSRAYLRGANLYGAYNVPEHVKATA